MNDDVNLNLRKILEDVDKGLVDFEYAQKLLLSEYSISNMRYRDNLGAKWGFWNEVANALDGVNLYLNNLHLLNFNNKRYILNLANLFPSEFCKNFDLFYKQIQSFSYKESCELLHLECNVKYIYNIFIKLNTVENSDFVIAFLFACNAAKLNTGSMRCRWVNSLSDDKNLFIENLAKINCSASNLTHISSEFHRPLGKNVRIALFVTGQVRSELSHFLEFSKQVTGVEFDLFFSSWRDKGGREIKSNNLNRYFDSNAINFMLNGRAAVDIEFYNNFSSRLKNNIGELQASEVQEAFSFCRYLYINIDDDNMPPFLSLTNPEKMYYHNSMWVNKLGRDFFNEYDLIIKTRPDVCFLSFDLESILGAINNNEYVSEDHCGLFFRSWGVGVGDQVLVGTPKLITNLLGIFTWSASDETCRTMLNHLKLPNYMGHVNLAIKTIINGFVAIPNKFFKIKFLSYSKFSIDEVKDYLRSEGEKINN